MTTLVFILIIAVAVLLGVRYYKAVQTTSQHQSLFPASGITPVQYVAVEPEVVVAPTPVTKKRAAKKTAAKKAPAKKSPAKKAPTKKAPAKKAQAKKAATRRSR